MSRGPDIVQVGATVGDHQLVKKLGEGAMGAVYEAVHGLIGKRVAIKVLKHGPDEGQVAARRLLEEARAVNAIGHRGVIDIFDAGLLADGRPYLVMELLQGRSLHDEVRRTKSGLPLKLVVHVLTGVLEALVAAHRAGVIHRDLKASNVFLVDEPSGLPLVKLVDFGIARRESRAEVLTMPSMTVGSMGFMAPEHIAGRPVPQSDLYACGCLAWLMLAGRPVFPYGNPGVLVQQHLREKPALVSTARKETPAELDAFIAWLLEKRVEDRPHSAEVALLVLKEAAQAFSGKQTAPGGPGFIEQARRYDASVRAASGARQAVTDVTPAFVPPGETEASADAARREKVPTRAERPPKVLTASPRQARPAAPRPRPMDTGDEDTLPPPEPRPFDRDAGTIVDAEQGPPRKPR